MRSLAPISGRLEKLILLLSSDKPGEVAAAAAAIERTLATVGCDWHDLAAWIGAKQQASYTEEHPSGDDWWQMREFCRRHSRRLRPREAEFIEDLVEWSGDLTEKQDAWLASIYRRLKRQAE